MECNVEDDSLMTNQQENLTLLLPHIKTEKDYPDFVNDVDLSNPNIEDDHEKSEEQEQGEKSTTKENHYCSRCGEVFPDFKYVQIHEAIHDSKLVCPACDRIFKTERYFVQHIESHLKKPLTCQDCPEIFFDKRSYNLHLYCHKKIKTHICEYCSKEWSNKKDLQIHIRVHTNERPYPCEVCGKSFKQRGGLRAHMDNLHSMETKQVIKMTYPCDICNGSYSSVSSLNKHIRKIHELGKTFPCRQCGEPFLNFLQMKQHKLEAHPELIYNKACPLCNKQFSHRESLVKHQRAHVEAGQKIDQFVMPINCYLCGEGTLGRKAFAKHQQFHLMMTDEEMEKCIKAKEFNCKVCGNMFNFKKNLFRHMDVHLDKTYECNSHCTEKFTYLGMRLHNEWHFNPFHCSQCDESFVGRKNLKKHYRIHHKRVKFICKVCGHQFRYRQLLVTHWKLHHNLKCYLCQNKFTTHLALKRHIKIKHKVNYTPDYGSLVQVKRASKNKVVQNTERNGMEYNCKTCKSSFYTKTLLKDHMKLHKKKCFQCDNCKRNFLYMRNLMFHIRQNICLKYHDNKKDRHFICSLCNKEYRTIQCLCSHMRTHITIYKCKFCNSKFKQKDLQEHINRAHPSEAKFVCDKCTLRFSSVSELTRHGKYFHRNNLIKSEVEDSVTDQTPGEDGEIKIKIEQENVDDKLSNNDDLLWIKEEPNYS